MENGFKARLYRIFRRPLKSCRARDLSYVNETHLLIQQNHPNNPPPSNKQLLNNNYYYTNSFPSMCKPKYCTEKSNTKPPINDSIIPRRKLCFFFAEEEGFTCPRGSPCEKGKLPTKKNKRNKKKKKNRERSSTQMRRSTEASLFSSSSQDRTYYNWFNNEEEEEEEESEETENDTVFFSSRRATFSSDSSGIVTSKQHRSARRRRRSRANSDIPFPCLKTEVGLNVMPLNKGVNDSFAVVKSSSDPYNDFRSSMVEMIIERQIFGAKELENLLKCFLALNSEKHQRVIVEVFTEVWEALFSS